MSGWVGTRLATVGADATFWLPAQRSTFAGRVDSAFYVIFWICVLFFVLILAMATFMLVKYRRRGDAVVVQRSAHHNTLLEVTWSGIPLVIVLAIFVMGFRGFMDLHTPPAGAYEVQVIAQKWAWSFTWTTHHASSRPMPSACGRCSSIWSTTR